MSETDITPALSAEDWREVLPNIIGSQAVPHQTMAIANAALPDDDPRKITRADVDAIETAMTHAIGYQTRGAIKELRAKLAALLPPE
jgi:hypothetical protein